MFLLVRLAEANRETQLPEHMPDIVILVKELVLACRPIVFAGSVVRRGGHFRLLLSFLLLVAVCFSCSVFLAVARRTLGRCCSPLWL